MNAINITTNEQKRRVLEAIAECDQYIAKEDARRADIRPARVAQTLAHAKAHRAKLIAALAAK